MFLQHCPICGVWLRQGNAPCTEGIYNNIGFCRRCESCGYVMEVRPRTPSDPPVIIPAFLTDDEKKRLEFHRWRSADDVRQQRRYDAAEEG